MKTSGDWAELPWALFGYCTTTRNSTSITSAPLCRYGDAVMELDWGVGQIVGAIKKRGLDKNTLVFFSSDNGAAEVDSAFGE